MSTRTCTNCNKPESSLPHPLKLCAKCHTETYCSRPCQKSHWKIHKRTCGRQTDPSQPTPGSLTNPPKSEILQNARDTVNLMRALSQCPGFNHVLRDIDKTHANLMYLADFVQRTFREYWFNLLPQRAATEMMLSCASFFGKDEAVERAEWEGKMREAEEEERPEVLRGLDVWPWEEEGRGTFDAEVYSDGVSRNYTAAKIVLDEGMQRGMGGVYKYSQEVRGLARRMVEGVGTGGGGDGEEERYMREQQGKVGVQEQDQLEVPVPAPDPDPESEPRQADVD